MMSEVDVGMGAEVKPSHQYSLHFFAVWLMVAEGQSDTMAPNMEVHMKVQMKCDIPPYLLNVSGDD